MMPEVCSTEETLRNLRIADHFNKRSSCSHGQNSRTITSALVAVKYKGSLPNVQSVCCLSFLLRRSNGLQQLHLGSQHSLLSGDTVQVCVDTNACRPNSTKCNRVDDQRRSGNRPDINIACFNALLIPYSSSFHS